MMVSLMKQKMFQLEELNFISLTVKTRKYL